MSNWRSLSVNKMIVKLARKLFLLSGATLISLFLPLVSVSAKTDTIKVGYTHGLELFQENETLKETVNALQSRIKRVTFKLEQTAKNLQKRSAVQSSRGAIEKT